MVLSNKRDFFFKFGELLKKTATVKMKFCLGWNKIFGYVIVCLGVPGQCSEQLKKHFLYVGKFLGWRFVSLNVPGCCSLDYSSNEVFI